MALRELVAAAVGYDEARGDVITLKSMDFEPFILAEPVVATSLLSRLPIDVIGLAKLAVLAVVCLILGLFVLRPILTARSGAVPELPAPTARRGPTPDPDQRVLTGEIDDTEFAPTDLALISDGTRTPSGSQAPERLPGKSDDPVTRLRQLITDRQTETVEILRGWMENSEEEQA